MNLHSFLRDHDIGYELFEHAPVMTVEESSRLVPPLPGEKTKNLFLRDKRGRRHFLVTVPAASAVDLASLGAALGVGRLSFASSERLEAHLGIKAGAVSVLALANDSSHAVEFVIDASLWNVEALQAHPLVNSATMVLTHSNLERFLAATNHAPTVIAFPAGPKEARSTP